MYVCITKIIFFIINYRIKELNKKSLNTNLKSSQNNWRKQPKKKTLASLGDGDPYNDKLN